MANCISLLYWSLGSIVTSFGELPERRPYQSQYSKASIGAIPDGSIGPARYQYVAASSKAKRRRRRRPLVARTALVSSIG